MPRIYQFFGTLICMYYNDHMPPHFHAKTKGNFDTMTETTTHRQVQMPLANDIYNIDSLLSEEERMVRDTVRKFVNERVVPIIGEHFEAGTFPRELILEIDELGLMGMHLKVYGCAGL